MNLLINSFLLLGQKNKSIILVSIEELYSKRKDHYENVSNYAFCI